MYCGTDFYTVKFQEWFFEMNWISISMTLDVPLWTPSHGRAKAEWPAQTYIQQLCEDIGCSPEDLPEAVNDRERWRERVRDIRADGTRRWDDDDLSIYVIFQIAFFFLTDQLEMHNLMSNFLLISYTISGFLANYISQSQRILYVSCSRTNSVLSIYHL